MRALVGWLDLRVAQRVEQRLGQEREHWRCYVVDLIAAEGEQFVALLQKKHATVIEVLKADQNEIFDWVQRVLEQSKKQAMAGFDRLEARLGQSSRCVVPTMMTASRHLRPTDEHRCRSYRWPLCHSRWPEIGSRPVWVLVVILT
jgi:hypothetical protein